MKRIASRAAATILSAGMMLAAGTAHAQDLLDAKAPERIEALLKGFGIARLEVSESSGDPKISGRIEGKPYVVFFYGCTSGANCKSVQFWAYWEGAIPDDKINAWNADTRYGKIYRDGDGDLVLEFDVNLVHGIAERTMEDNIDLWVTLVDRVNKVHE